MRSPQQELDTTLGSHDVVWPAASFGQRLTAFLLDNIIVTAVASFLAMLLPASTRSALTTILPTFYFIYFHIKTGQTLGKRLVGIRVLSMHQGNSEEPLPTKDVILRETVGKFLSGILLLYGYLRVITREDKLALHDKLSSTHVVSLRTDGAKSVRLVHVVSALAAVAIIGGSGFYYALMHTAWPLRKFAENLELQGYEIEGISGNLKKGFSVSRIARTTEELSFEVRDINFQYNESQRDGVEYLIVKDLSIGSARVSSNKPLDEIAKSFRKDQEPSGEAKTGVSQPKKVAKTGGIQIETLDFNNIEIQLPGKPAYKVNRVYVGNLQALRDASSMSLERLWIQSDFVDLDLSDLSSSGRLVQMGKPARGTLKPGIAPDFLRAPIDFQIQATLRDRTVSKLNATAMNRRVQIDWNDQSIQLTIAGLTLQHYFKTDIPLWNLSATVAGNLKSPQDLRMSGSFHLRNSRFELGQMNAVHQRGQKAFAIGLMLDKSVTTAKTMKPILKLVSNQETAVPQILADLYFSRPLQALAPNELQFVTNDRKYFIEPAVPAAVPMDATIRLPTSSVAPQNPPPQGMGR